MTAATSPPNPIASNAKIAEAPKPTAPVQATAARTNLDGAAALLNTLGEHLGRDFGNLLGAAPTTEPAPKP